MILFLRKVIAEKIRKQNIFLMSCGLILRKCLLLDGYRIDQNKIVTIEPFIETRYQVDSQ